MSIRYARLAAILVAFAVTTAPAASSQSIETLVQRFTKAFLPYLPATTVEMRINQNAATPVGQYLSVTAVRSSVRDGGQKDQLGMLVDPAAKLAVVGYALPLPPTDNPVTPDNLPAFVEQALPNYLRMALSSTVRLRWPGVPTRLGPVVVLSAEVETGYGMSKMPLAISADGKWIVIGGAWPLDRDPRAVRREVLDTAPVQWDPGHEKAVVKVIEFSDYQCPACKRGWSEMQPVFASFGDKLRHGLVNFPLVQNHPWAFRAAVAGTCVGSLWPDKLLALKSEMYRLQADLSVQTVDDAVFGFLTQQGLDEKQFRDCYMKDAAIDKVLLQMEFAHRLGVLGTPTYFVGGEVLPWGNPALARRRLEAIIAAGGKPENAAEVEMPAPEPTPAAPPPSPAATH